MEQVPSLSSLSRRHSQRGAQIRHLSRLHMTLVSGEHSNGSGPEMGMGISDVEIPISIILLQGIVDSTPDPDSFSLVFTFSRLQRYLSGKAAR